MASQYFRLEAVTDGVWAAIVNPGTGAWGNAGIIDLGDRTIVFDTFATPGAARELRAAAEKLTGRPVSIVVNSHRHIDHVGGTQVFEGAEVIATAATRELIATRMPPFLQYGKEHPEALDNMAARAERETDPARRREALNELGEFRAITGALDEYRIILPTATFEGRLTLHGTKRTAELFSPGGCHTPSDAVLWLPAERILFAGDVVQIGFHPMISQGSPEAWEAALALFAEMAPERIVPGHGPVGDATAIATLQAYFAALRALVAAGAPPGPVDMPELCAGWEAPSVFEGNVKFLAERGGR